MPNNDQDYCVELTLVPMTCRTPKGSLRKTLEPGGYATGDENFLSYNDLAASHGEVSTFSEEKAEKLAAAWRKLGCHVEVVAYKPEGTMA